MSYSLFLDCDLAPAFLDPDVFVATFIPVFVLPFSVSTDRWMTYSAIVCASSFLAFELSYIPIWPTGKPLVVRSLEET
jgi:hypothetical protein